jgi:hypothetical protein
MAFFNNFIEKDRKTKKKLGMILPPFKKKYKDLKGSNPRKNTKSK